MEAAQTDVDGLITIGFALMEPDLLTEIVVLFQILQAYRNLLLSDAGEPVSVSLEISSADVQTDTSLHCQKLCQRTVAGKEIFGNGHALFHSPKLFCQFAVMAIEVISLILTVEKTQQRILIKQVLGRVNCRNIQRIAARQAVQFGEEHPLFHGSFLEQVKFLVDSSVLRLLGETFLSEKDQRKQTCCERSLGTVIHPESHKRIADLLLFHDAHTYPGAIESFSVIGNQAVPGPAAACEIYFIGELFMKAQHSLVGLRIMVVVIPVNHGQVIAGFILLFPFVIFRNAVVGAVLGCQVEEHIAPHHGLQTVFSAKLLYFFQVTFHDGKTVGKAVFFQILAETQAVSLVHAKMYFLCADTLGEVFQHALDEGIGLLFLGKQVVSVVLQTVADRPAKEGAQMCQSLDAGNQANAEELAVSIALFQLLFGKSSAESAEIRIFRKLVGILGVKKDLVHTQESHGADHAFQHIRCRNTVSGAVRHSAQAVHINGLLFHEIGILKMTEEMADAAEEMSLLFAGDGHILSFFLNF